MYPNQYPYPNTAQTVPYQRQLQYVKDFLKRPITYVIAALLTLDAIFFFLTSIFNKGEDLTGNPAYTGGYVIGAIVAIIPFGLIVLGAWLISTKSANPAPHATPSAGLTIIKVLTIIFLVIFCLLFVIAIILLLGFSAAGSYADSEAFSQFNYFLYSRGIDESVLSAFIGIAIFIVLIAFVYILLCFIALLRFISSLKASMKSPLLKTGGSIMLAVLSIMFAVGCFINLFGGSWIQVIESLLFLALSVCLAVVSITYNKYAKAANAEISAMMNPYPQGYQAAPVPQPPVYVAQVPQQPMNPQYPYQQTGSQPNQYPQNYTQPAPQSYDNPYVQQTDVPTQMPTPAAVQSKYCPACGTPTTNPDETTCINCGYKF